MAKKFFHTDIVVDRVVDVLRQNLPEDWTTITPTDIKLTSIQPGDLRDYSIDSIVNLSPIVLVRSIGVEPTQRGGAGGVRETAETIRIILIRSFDHCMTTSGLKEQNMCRARYRYTEELCEALFSDPHAKLALIDDDGVRTELSLSSTDAAGAQVVVMTYGGVDYGGETEDTREIISSGAKAWAVAVDFRVVVRSGGEYN